MGYPSLSFSSARKKAIERDGLNQVNPVRQILTQRSDWIKGIELIKLSAKKPCYSEKNQNNFEYHDKNHKLSFLNERSIRKF